MGVCELRQMLSDILPISIGIGIFYNFLVFEWLGLSAGSLVVPGYFALALNKPINCGLTWLIGLITHALVRLISQFTLIYGRRQLGLNIVIGYLLAALANHVIFSSTMLAQRTPIAVVGFIIPGLIANSLFNHGIIATTCELLICSIATRLTLIILLGSELHTS